MKTTKILAILVLALGLMVCPAELAGAATMGTGFTYQGRLVDDNSVANGLYDFQFKVFDNVIFGNQQGHTIYINELNVIDGNFTVELDFGSGIFYGDTRWLEIGVRPGGSTDSFTILIPLQEIKPTPNSIHATHALQADEADTLNGFDSTAFASVAHSHDGVYALIGHTHDGSDIKTGTVAEGLIDASIARDSEITWGNLANIPVGFADDIDDIGGPDSDWTISGNDIYSGVAGNVGIGTSSPLSKLSVGGNGIAQTGVYGSGVMYGVYGSGNNFGVYGSGSIGVHGHGKTWGVIGIDSDTGSYGLLGSDTWGGYFFGDGYFSGNVGIGTNSPNEKLTVEGALSLDEISAPSASAGYGKIYVKSTDSKLYFKDDAGTEYKLTAGGDDFVAGDFLICANDTDRFTIATSRVPLKESKIGRSGTLRIKFDLRAFPLGITVYAQIYRNNAPIGTMRTTTSTSYVTYSEDISGWSKGDLVQVWGFTGNSSISVRVGNFRLYVDNPAEAGARL